ncbi:MAG TPA: lysophospholipid acyltransferase family protein, partial [Rubricoccaceae bacterium]
HVDPPQATWATRLWFWWAVLWTALLCLVLSPGLVVHSALRPTARTFVTWMRPWSRSILFMIRVRTRVEVRAPLPEGPVVFVSNHQNAVDILTTSACLPRPFVYVARHELRAWPIVGWVLEKSACLFIDRSSARRAIESLREAGARIRGGESVLLFPEGGRSYAHRTEPFMRGAFMLALEAGVPVVPLTLVGHSGVMNEKLRLARPGETRLVLGAPVETAGLGRGDVAELSDRVRASIEAELARFG